MKKTIILNLPFKATCYNKNEIVNFENWIYFFADKNTEIIITPPIERIDITFSENVMKLANISIIHVPSFDTCDRWKAGLLKALENQNTNLFYLWSADFQFSELSKVSAEKLLEYENEYDLVVGTIKAIGIKELIDTLGTLPMLEHWFYKESDFIIKNGFSKPRSELLRISRKFLEFSITKRWYPSEQTINLILQCLWHDDIFTMRSLSLEEIKDDDQSRETPNVVQQIERMELWLKYMWRDRNKNWSPSEYFSICEKSHKILKSVNNYLLFKSQNINDVHEVNYRFIIEDCWKDVHHSRNQDWTALGVVFGAHLGIFNLLEYLKVKISSLHIESIYYIIGSISGIALSLIGALIAYRHRSLMKLKMQWITAAEIKLGLLKTQGNPSGIIDPKKYKGISNSWLIISIYLLFIIVDLLIIKLFSY
jgi:hypothetical protein